MSPQHLAMFLGVAADAAEARARQTVVHDVATVFLPLAQRMDEVPALRVRIFLNINRTPRDTALDSELVREFADQFRRAWPGQRRPEIYYDPRGLSADSGVDLKPGRWHAEDR